MIRLVIRLRNQPANSVCTQRIVNITDCRVFTLVTIHTAGTVSIQSEAFRARAVEAARGVSAVVRAGRDYALVYICKKKYD